MSKIEVPHIFKKGKPLKLKNLDDPTQKKEYLFSTEKVGVHSIGSLCNNMNQILARCWLNTIKINHYFGISKDVSKDISKNKTPFGQFKKDIILFKNDNDTIEKLTKQLEKLSSQLKDQNEIIQKIYNKTEHNRQTLDILLKDVAEKIVFQDLVNDFQRRIKDVQNQLKQLIG